MKRLTLLALAMVLTLAVPTAAQGERYEAESLWSDDETVTMISIGNPEVVGMENDDFCRTMAYLLDLLSDDPFEPDPEKIDLCAGALAGPLAIQANVPEAWLPLITGSAEPQKAKAVKVSGKGSKNTKPFMLAAGDYRVALKRAKRGCDQFTYGYLMATDGSGSPSGEVAQNGYVYGVAEGRYYWEATADDKCKWTYILTPLD